MFVGNKLHDVRNPKVMEMNGSSERDWVSGSLSVSWILVTTDNNLRSWTLLVVNKHPVQDEFLLKAVCLN